jgi:hypothetical protein
MGKQGDWWESRARNATVNLGTFCFPTFSQVIAFADFGSSRRDRHDLILLFELLCFCLAILGFARVPNVRRCGCVSGALSQSSIREEAAKRE